MDLEHALKRAKAEAPPFTVKGIKAMEQMSRGYTSHEIGERMVTTDKQVCAWVSKAKKYLRSRPEGQALAAVYCIKQVENG